MTNLCIANYQFKSFLDLIMKYIHFVLATFLFVALCLADNQKPSKIVTCTLLPFLPMPKSIKCSLQPQPVELKKPCNILYSIKNSKDGQYSHFIQLIEHQQLKTFDCHNSHVLVGQLLDYKPVGFQYQVNIQVQYPQLKSVFTTKQQVYNITIESTKASIQAKTYVGFVRALQTFMQSIICNKKKTSCTLSHTPIAIQDEPAFAYRGLMIDTARHYQPIHLIYETIDALMYNKMSIMHWHLVDQDSFPIRLDSHPQIAEYGAFSPEQIYTPDQMRDIIRYAKVRGVRVIPELDTPGHAASWGRAPQNKKVACAFGGIGYMGPLDVTLDQTYQLVRDVFKQIFQIFPDPIVHLGGDEVMLTCMSNKTQFMIKQKIMQNQIQLHYRRKQKKMLKQLNPNKRFMYWMNSQIKLQKDDIVHWWGSNIPDTQCDIVISNYGPFYIDMGVGNYFGYNYGNYVTWLQLYNQDLGKMVSSLTNKQKILGAQVTLWSQLSNRYTHHSKIWIRTSSLAQRAWTTANYNAKPQFLSRLTTHQKLMHRRGIPTAPATCQQCQGNAAFC